MSITGCEGDVPHLPSTLKQPIVNYLCFALTTDHGINPSSLGGIYMVHKKPIFLSTARLKGVTPY